MVCFGSNSMTDKQTVTKMPGKTNLLSSIKLKSIFKNPLAYNNKHSIKEQRLLQLKNKKSNITNICLIDRNVQNSNNGDGGSDDFNNDDGDIDNEAGDDKDNDDGDTNDDGGDDGGTNDAGEDNDDDGDAGDDDDDEK